MPFAILANHLSKTYHSGGNEAISDLSLEIPYGQLYGLVGPDGAGKTTCMRILASVMKPSHGDAWVNGASILNQPEEVRRSIGYMPQNFSLYPDLSIFENLSFYADVHRIPAVERKQRFEQLLQFSRLHEFKDRRAGQLSGGMRKKLALTCALIHEPKVLLLDEPTTGVDPLSRRELWQILLALVNKGVAILVTTPYMDEAERCHKVGFLYEGKLLVDSNPESMEAQLGGKIYAFRAGTRKTVEPVLNKLFGENSWRMVGNHYRLFSMLSLIAVKQSLEKFTQETGIQCNNLQEVHANMEDVFIRLAEKEKEKLEQNASN